MTFFRLEWMKIRNYRTFWILMGLFILAAGSVNFIMFKVQGEVTTQTQGNLQLDLFHAPYLWNTTGWLMGFTLVLPAFLIILLTTHEFTYKTLRQDIINGLSRQQAVFSKWLLLLLIALICWIIYFLINIFIGSSGSGNQDIFSGFQYAGYMFLKTLLALSVAFLFSLWIKRTGLTIALFLVYYLLGEAIVGYFLNKIYAPLGIFLPLHTGSVLVSNPFKRYIHFTTVNQPADYWFLLVGIGWLGLFVFLSVRYMKRTDL